MPPVFRFYLRQAAIGFAVAALLTGGLLVTDTGGLWHLVTHTAEGPLALFLLWFFNGIVFGGAQAGIAVFLMAEPEEPKGPPRRAAPSLARLPVVARASR